MYAIVQVMNAGVREVKGVEGRESRTSVSHVCRACLDMTLGPFYRRAIKQGVHCGNQQ